MFGRDEEQNGGVKGRAGGAARSGPVRRVELTIRQTHTVPDRRELL